MAQERRGGEALSELESRREKKGCEPTMKESTSQDKLIG